MTVRVVIVDDQALVRAGFRMVLDSQPDLEVVGEAVDGADAAAAARPHRGRRGGDGHPDADAWTGWRRPGGSAPTARRPPRVLVLTTFDTDEDAFAALQAGASGFLLKNVPPEELLAAIRVVAAGRRRGGPGDHPAAARPVRRASSAARPDRGRPRWPQLTEREREVLLLVAQGLSNAEIAARAARRRGDGEDPRRADPGQAPAARPGPGGGAGVRERAGHPRRMTPRTTWVVRAPRRAHRDPGRTQVERAGGDRRTGAGHSVGGVRSTTCTGSPA